MPTGWTRIGTPEALKALYDSPYALKKEILRRVTRSGAGLDEVYFDPSGSPAYALVHFPGTPTEAEETIERVEQALGSESLPLLTVEELEEAESSGGSAD